MDLRVTTRDGGGGVSIVEVTGELELAHCPTLRSELIRLASNEKPLIVVSLEGVTFIDSTGLGVLIGGHKRARERGGHFGVVCANPRHLQIFAMTGLTKVLNIFASVDAAVEGVRE